MSLHNIAIATITWARTQAEDEALRRSLPYLTDFGVPIAIADRGEERGFVRFLEHLPHARVVVPPEHGLVSQVQASLELAREFDREFVLYVEPDKALFFSDHLRDFVERSLRHSDVGVAIAARSSEALRTFPPMQRYTEGVINRLTGETIGVEGDYSYGPFLIRTSLLDAAQPPRPTLGWGWRHFAFIAAHHAGAHITHTVGDYECPVDQRDESTSDRLHRIRQLSDNLQGLAVAASAFREEPNAAADRGRVAS